MNIKELEKSIFLAGNMLTGNVIGGSAGGKIFIRLKSNQNVGVGDILLIKEENKDFFVKITNVKISSLIPSQFIEDIAGQRLEYEEETNIFDLKDKFYRLCEAKVLKIKSKDGFLAPRTIPHYFSKVYKIKSTDFSKIIKRDGIEIGYLRLGTNFIKDVIISLPAEKLIRHHMLVVATTGKGKSNFAKVFLSGLLQTSGHSCIVFDPHAEYYGSKGVKGLRDHQNREKAIYFTSRVNEFPGSEKLIIHSCDLLPSDFEGLINLSPAQIEAMDAIYKKKKKEWLNSIIKQDVEELYNLFEGKVMKITLSSLKRKLSYIMEIDEDKGLIFTLEKRENESIFDKILTYIKKEKTIIIDASLIGNESEKLISSAILNKVMYLYKKAKQSDLKSFNLLPECMVLFEEAPRVLGSEVLARGTNIFERIAREGRKFKIGLCAITQMPSLLPKEILSQMNTKVILGLPSHTDRNAVIESSPQNIQDENVEIQMLDKGEALVTSSFIDFPLPVKIFYFNDLLKNKEEKLNILGIG